MNCEECGTRWDSQAAADACATDDRADDNTRYSPSRSRISYTLSDD